MRSALSLLVVLGAPGCGGITAMHPVVASTTSSVSTIEAAAVSDLVDRDPHAYGGVTMFVASSLQTLALTPDQRKRFAPIVSELYAHTDISRDATSAFLSVLAEGIAAEAIDASKIASAIDRLGVEATAVYDHSTDVLNRLHAILSPEQRGTVADGVEARWMAWREANPPKETFRPAGQLATIADALGLEREQLDAMRRRFDALMSRVPPLDVERLTQRIRAFEVAFASEQFDALTLPQAAIGADVASWSATRIAHLCQACEGLLTPEQRTRLVRVLHDRAASHGLL